MKTTLKKPGEIEKQWYVIDAKDQVLGRMSTKIADILRGKNKPYFSPHMDCGDFVVVINADKIKLTGKKWSDKMYARHSGFPGGFKEESAEKLNERKPTKLVELAVSGMLPKNRLRKVFMGKLKIYAGEEHPHVAQSPLTLEV
ncbi:50S ribosomal protein L13 [Candidatus Peregrinibacteria bacterium CG10_big_fil_rev_8_21_14_0_10_36_19]|nr:MAG: 50S ribosomal protein L13 [Candidatus Peregrinibacteria bacterium CG10_big_fil_rev_8_21_14_0_10_36_19]